MKPKKIALLYSLALGLLGLLLLIAKGFHFENNDDVGMFCMVKGLLQFEPTPHLFFQSSYLGYLYQWLYANLPEVEWYFVMYYFFILAGLVYVSYCILSKVENTGSTFTSLLICFLASSDVLLGGLQFTKVSIWLGFAASAGVAFYLRGNRHWSHLFLAILFLLFGMLYRDSFAVVPFGIFSAGFPLLWIRARGSARLLASEARRILTIYGMAAAIMLSIFWLNGNVIKKHLQGFAEDNTKRAWVNDFGLLKKLEANPELMEKYIQQFPELELMQYWMYPKEFAKNKELTQALEEIHNLPKSQGRLLDSIKATTLRFVSGWQNKVTIFFIFALLIISYFQKKKISWKIWIVGIVLILFFYCTGYIYKTVPPRMGNTLLTAGLFYCLSFMGLNIPKNFIQKVLRYISIAAAAFLICWGYIINMESAKKSDRTFAQLTQLADAAAIPVFLTYDDMHGSIYLEDLMPTQLNQLKPGKFFTIGWCMSHPAYLAALKMHFGGDDILRILMDGKMLLTHNPYNRVLASKLLIYEKTRKGEELQIIPFEQDSNHLLKLETKN